LPVAVRSSSDVRSSIWLAAPADHPERRYRPGDGCDSLDALGLDGPGFVDSQLGTGFTCMVHRDAGAEIRLSINGVSQSVSVAPGTPLLFVLRNELKLTGPRLGCGMAQCGACAVLLEGKEVRACITPVSFAEGKQVTTVEGLPALWAAQRSLNPGDSLHPVQQAWIDEQVPQCGYCQSGMMVAAVDLLSRNPDPTVAQIKDAFTNTPPSPHLCRCGTYAAIIDAVRRAAKAMRS
jgi:isoquinoline 1-oxidoreductase alpha subunit